MKQGPHTMKRNITK